jgi:hypothetical protein
MGIGGNERGGEGLGRNEKEWGIGGRNENGREEREWEGRRMREMEGRNWN